MVFGPRSLDKIDVGCVVAHNASVMNKIIDMPTTQGWRANLDLHYQSQGSRTLLSHVHEGPLRVQRPFFPEGDVNHTYVLHPPGGLVGNDALNIDLRVDAGAHALVTTPGATKAYRNICDASVMQQNLVVAGALEWLPQETILFDGSKVDSRTTIELAADARLIAWEIQCLGRPAGELPYLSGAAQFNLVVRKDTKPLLQDRLVIDGDSPILQAPWGLDGHSATGVMLASPADKTICDLANQCLQNFGAHGSSATARGAATLLDELLVVRVLDQQAQNIRRAFIDVWQAIRPALLNRPACQPRIWHT